MSLHFEKLQIKEVRQETNNCVSLLLDIPEALQEKFKYQHGQNITIRTIINGEEVRRSYSLCSSPLDNEWRVAVKQVDKGIFSTHANTALKAGDIIEVMPPVGKFSTPLHPEQKKSYVGFAAGSGITPLLSIIKTVLRTEPHSSFTLVYGNKNRHSIIFKEDLEALKNKYLQRFQIIYILSREKTDATLNFGRIDQQKLAQLSHLIPYQQADDFFVCGPEEMIFAVKDFLEQEQIDKKKIHFELFTSPNQKKGIATTVVNSGEQTAGSNITVKLDGRSFDFKLPFNGTNILDAALQQGADLPYACKGGVCCTCKAKLLEGEVTMDVHWGLEHEEIEQGYILTCQSHPVTEKIVVDFDIK